MDHGRLDVEDRKNDESKIVIRGNQHFITGGPGMFTARTTQSAVRIYWTPHLRRGKRSPAFAGTDRDVKVLIIGNGGCVSQSYISQVKADNDPPGFIADREHPGCGVLFLYAITDTTISIDIKRGNVIDASAITVGIFPSAGAGIANSEAGGVFDDDPGEHQT